MFRTFAVLALATLLPACSGDQPPPLPTGSWHVLNPGQWDIDPATTPTPLDLKDAS